MDLYVWTPNGSSLFRLYRDVEYWDAIKRALDDFWWNHVQPAKELYNKSKFTDPLTQLRLLKSDIAFSLIDHCYCLEPNDGKGGKVPFAELVNAYLQGLIMLSKVQTSSSQILFPISLAGSCSRHSLKSPLCFMTFPVLEGIGAISTET
uniref:Uncharacterized protein n=1 Tax=Chenopodium quinoa TaxID=63459 RepID=A0A803KVS0_CHEQI